MSSPISRGHILKKGDMIIIAVILCIAGVTALLIMNQKQGNQVIIISGDSKEIYSLDKNRSIKVNYKDGGYNVIIIEDGRVWVEEADCKNQVCVNHKPVYKDHESIICIPHKLSIQISSNKVNDIDN